MSEQQELFPLQPGALLQQERNIRELSVDDVSRATGIAPSTIKALESGETGHIPGIYLKGHYLRYARFLEIDSKSFEERLKDVSFTDTELKRVFEPGKRRGGDRWLKVSGYVAASVMIAALAWQFTHEAVRFSQGGPDREVSDSVAGSGGQTAEPADATHLKASIAAVEVLQDGTESAGRSDPAADGQNPEDTDNQHVLALTTSADSWVEIYGEDEIRLEMDLVRAGSQRIYRGAGPFHVNIGRASAVQLTLDGDPVDLEPHTRDNVASLVLAESAVEPGDAADNH